MDIGVIGTGGIGTINGHLLASEAGGTGGHIEGLGQQVWNGFVLHWLDELLRRPSFVRSSGASGVIGRRDLRPVPACERGARP